jgi:glycosyltransferase involved in cell wall biosynthesis
MISVCMAVFNGERYLEEQLRSVLVQLANDDEVIVVDDCSLDGSVDLIRHIDDPRIILLQNKANSGPAASFERAFSLAKGKYIFLSDQDDIWEPDKVAIICRIFDSSNSLVVVSDARVVDANRNTLMDSLFRWRGSRAGFWRNLYKNGFVGCCMAVRSDAKSFLLPFPTIVGMHDEWIGLCSSLAGRVEFIDSKLIDYRRHAANVTHMGHGSLASMLRKRLTLLVMVCQRLPHILFWRSRQRSKLGQ